ELLGKGSMTDDGGQLRLDEPYVGREQRAKVLDEGVRTRRGAPALREAGDPFLGSAVRSGGWGGCRAGCAHLVTLLAGRIGTRGRAARLCNAVIAATHTNSMCLSYKQYGCQIGGGGGGRTS